MTEEKFKKLIPFLAIVLIAIVLWQLRGVKKSKPRISKEPRNIFEEFDAIKKVDKTKVLEQNITEDIPEDIYWERNIFLPVIEGGTKGEKVTGIPIKDLKLTGIVRKGDKKIAIVNDILVFEGDTIGDKRVAEIRNDKILLENSRGERFIVTFVEEEREGEEAGVTPE